MAVPMDRCHQNIGHTNMVSQRNVCMLLRIDYGDDGAIHALVHSNLNSSALDYHN